MSKVLRVIRPASRENPDLMPQRIPGIVERGYRVLYEAGIASEDWPYSGQGIESRHRAVMDALLEDESDLVLCARGGYGASDLLPLVEWQKLAQAPAKWLAGFSDVSSLHSALYTKLGWPSLHGPMPATSLWGKGGEGGDLEEYFSTIASLLSKNTASGCLNIEPMGVDGFAGAIDGVIFGGCFTVLTNLIGTPFLPRSFEDHILLFEDTGESPGRIFRALNQWLQAGLLKRARALVFGCLNDMGPIANGVGTDKVYREIAYRTGIPTFKSKSFGHVSPNYPFVIGSRGRVEAQTLTWFYGGCRGVT